MSNIFSVSNYVLKREGLSIGGKYRIIDPQSKVALCFIEEKTKWIPPSKIIHIYSDEKKKNEVLTLKDRPSGSIEDMDIFDSTNGQKIGSLVSDAESISEVFKDVWSILDAEENTIGKVYEKNLSKSLLRELVSKDIPQKMEIKIGDVQVGELRQKLKAVGYELEIDMSMDVSSLLDHRLGIAAGILIAYHQSNEVDPF